MRLRPRSSPRKADGCARDSPAARAPPARAEWQGMQVGAVWAREGRTPRRRASGDQETTTLIETRLKRAKARDIRPSQVTLTGSMNWTTSARSSRIPAGADPSDHRYQRYLPLLVTGGANRYRYPVYIPGNGNAPTAGLGHRARRASKRTTVRVRGRHSRHLRRLFASDILGRSDDDGAH
jgi:hypothetical protein